MARTKTAIAFAAGAACTAALAFAVGFGPDDYLKKGEKAVQDAKHQGEKMINEVMGNTPEGMEGMSPEKAAEMQAWIEASTPGENHTMLAKSVGEWTCTAWFKMDPNMPPQEGAGTMSVKPVLDGRYFISHFSMPDFMGPGGDMNGIACMAYDNIKGKFVSTWIDSMSTGIFVSEGKMKDNELVMKGSFTMPDGTEKLHKMVTAWNGEDQIVDSFYEKNGDEWYQHGEITYTRTGHADAANN